MWLFKLQGEEYSIIVYQYCQRKNRNYWKGNNGL